MTTTTCTTELLSDPHQSAAPWLTRMGAGQVLNLPVHVQQRWLRVEQGCLWVTALHHEGPRVAREADIWLKAGESLHVPAGSAWVLQAWPSAQVLLVQPAGEGRRARLADAALSSIRRGWRALWLAARAALPQRARRGLGLAGF
jgi:Protein of unknown function (DUF2917)